MPRLMVYCAAAVLALSGCSGDTADKNAAAGGASGAGGAGGSAGGLSGRRGAPGSQEDLTLYAGDRIYFDTDQSVVTGEAVSGKPTGRRRLRQRRQLFSARPPCQSPRSVGV